MARHDAFKAAVHALDADALAATMTDDVVFRSPAVYEPYAGKEGAMVVLRAVMEVFEDFRYVDELEGADSAVLVFEARVDEMQLQGIDHLTFDEDGMVTSLTVMVRPFHGLQRLLERVGEEIGRQAAAAAT